MATTPALGQVEATLPATAQMFTVILMEKAGHRLLPLTGAPDRLLIVRGATVQAEATVNLHMSAETATISM